MSPRLSPASTSTQSPPTSDASPPPDHDADMISVEDFDRIVKDAIAALAVWQRSDFKEHLRIITEHDPQLETIHTLDAANIVLSKNPELCEALGKAQQSGKYAEVRKTLLSLQPRISFKELDETNASKTATALSWDHPFQGSAHKALWRHISKYATMNKSYYSPCCSIVQSSGTGKSRCIDELSKEQLVVPMNLRHPEAGGFPAPDEQLYDYFTTEHLTANDSVIHINAFLCALFTELQAEIESEYQSDRDSGGLALWLHELMTEGQTFSSQGPRRVAFYNKVVEQAEHLKKHWPSANSPRLSQPPKSPSRVNTGPPANENHASKKATEAALNLFEACKKAEPATKRSERPSIVLAFDEANTLTRTRADTDETTSASSPFAFLRRALREIGAGVFTVFLSTTGKITQFNPPRELDPSNRVSSGALATAPPFTALGWDQLARQIQGPSEGGIDFENIGFDYQVYLGRPMFGTRYHAAIKDKAWSEDPQEALLRFAAEKLLCASYPLASINGPSPDQEVACLAQRLPIEFMSTTHAAPTQRKQVENHMRVCIAVGELRLVTMSSSEPILSDAAATVMSDYEGKKFVPRALSRLLSGCSIHTGDRGEWAGVLLAILARDEVVQQDRPYAPQYPGFFTVLSFLEKLFVVRNPSTSESRGNNTKVILDDILAAKPSVYRDDSAKDTSLATAFDGVYLHFNHFIKRGTHNLTRDQLIRFFVRNAAFMTANSQAGIDFGLVTCKGSQILPTSTSLFMVQVKNDSKFSSKIDQSLFNSMDPVGFGISTDDLHVPLIRVVMALAGKKPAVTYVKTQKKGSFTSYDIWVSGLSKAVYPLVTEDNSAVWQDIVQASNSFQQGMKDSDEHVKELKMSMMPMSGDPPVFWSWFKRGTSQDADEDVDTDLSTPTNRSSALPEMHAGPSTEARRTSKRRNESEDRTRRNRPRYGDAA
ncbi:unnamed protein product [Peniophora sp. CBMAI 1063]|nr:unnamed protein product [Peniophora sp. CBMAI 1063]